MDLLFGLTGGFFILKARIVVSTIGGKFSGQQYP
jgi:hypothetical protein